MVHFPGSGVEVNALLPLLVAFAVSALTAPAGVSGAFLLLPFQVSVLGFDSPAVSPTNLVYNIFATPGGVYRYVREGRVVWPLAWTVILGTLPGSLVLALAPALRQSQELFGKIASYYRDLGRPVPPQGERRLSLDLENGSRIITLPGSKKTVRGFSGVGLLIVDEAARVEDQLYYACRPMLALSDGSLMMLSTPASKRGVFYSEWTSGLGWERYEVKAYDCPRITAAFLEEERKALPPPVFRAEYECSFEALDDQPFSEAMIASAFADESVKPLFSGM